MVTDIVIHHPGYHVTHLDSTALISDIIDNQAFELALLDFGLAKNDDFRLVRKLRETYPEIAILLLIDSADDEFSVHAVNAGANGFFHKPFTYEKFALIHDPGYWNALARSDWWEANADRLVDLEDAGV